MDITEFLLARIAADEEAAKRAAFGWGAEWGSAPDAHGEWFFVNAEAKRGLVDGEDADVINHIAAHDPARVLRECAAKREILQRLGPDENGNSPIRNLTIQLLMASAYSDHPDYQQEWPNMQPV